MAERALASTMRLPQPLFQHGLPEVSRGSCVVEIADGTWKRLARSKLARQDVALCSIDGLPRRLVPDLRHDLRHGAVVVVGGPGVLVASPGLANDIPQPRPIHPWLLEQQGLLVDHGFEHVLLVEDHVQVSVQKDHPDGQELATASHVELELADVSRVRYRLQRRGEVAQSQRTKRPLVKPRRRHARASVAAQPATRAESAGSVWPCIIGTGTLRPEFFCSLSLLLFFLPLGSSFDLLGLHVEEPQFAFHGRGEGAGSLLWSKAGQRRGRQVNTARTETAQTRGED